MVVKDEQGERKFTIGSGTWPEFDPVSVVAVAVNLVLVLLRSQC